MSSDTPIWSWAAARAQELYGLWHTYRIPIIVLLSVATLAVKLRIYLEKYQNGRRRTPNATSLLPSAGKAEDPRELEARALSPLNSRKAAPAAPSATPALKAASQSSKAPKRIVGKKPRSRRSALDQDVRREEPVSVRISVFFWSLTGNTEVYAKEFVNELSKSPLLASLKCEELQVQLHDLSNVDYDDYFVSPSTFTTTKVVPVRHVYLFLIPSYNIDTLLDTFLLHLQETHHDFRVDNAPLSPLLGYSVFGFGDRTDWPTEEAGFCSQARQLDRWMAKLTGGKRAFPLGMADVQMDARREMQNWMEGVAGVIRDASITGELGDGVVGSGDPTESGDESAEEETAPREGPPPTRRKAEDSIVEDVEEISRSMAASGAATSKRKTGNVPSSDDGIIPTLKEMVPRASPTYAALTKQGYTIVGSHSGVKICRWTKSALRGRGSCYKFSFYGIKSHLCMETTPSLSCSNKCVFCWRHGTNPVGTTWRWKVDPPEMIFAGAKEGHYQKIRMMRGVPGVRADRFAEAFRIRHCALSLVGEPIFYPHINRFTALLHQEHVSTFVVCNAQHPDELAALAPVTQLYVSIDASNRASLRRIDRPLHRDFWERFQRCLDILREKRFRQRTVFRLTLVKGFNIDDEVPGYADLVARALPCFIEIKGVTYCGKSTSSSQGLSMSNVPFYAEVTEFVRALDAELHSRGLDYGIAAEHAHSCCVLMASHRFRVEDRWHTIIDYDRFFELLEAGADFAPEDYMGPATPEWALWGNGGFDPADERFYRKSKTSAAG